MNLHLRCVALLGLALPTSAQAPAGQAPTGKAPAGQAQAKRASTIRGITISTHGMGRDWGRDQIVPCMEELRSVGANWACTHPYGRIYRDGRVHDYSRQEAPAYVVRPIREAHKKGMKILIKPHLAYWGSGFRWRGDIEFKSDEDWDRFFRDYTNWIVKIAAASTDADAFAVGTELDKTLQFTDRWKKVIAAIRKVTKVPLTYAANWTDYKRVKFWKDLDAIGIQAYFPLADKPGATEQQLTDAWGQLMGQLRDYSKQQDRYIVFTELGYTRSHNAPVRPWEYHQDGADAETVQKTCLRVALQAVEKEPRVLGSFLWKWFPPPSTWGRNFRLARPALKAVISAEWLDGSSRRSVR